MLFIFLHQFCKKKFQSNKHIVHYIKKCADMLYGFSPILECVDKF
jgi:hypothetical protein